MSVRAYAARAFASRLADLRALAPIGARGQVAPSALPRGAPAALPYPTPPQPRRPAPVQLPSHPAVHPIAPVCDWREGCTRSLGASEWQHVIGGKDAQGTMGPQNGTLSGP